MAKNSLHEFNWKCFTPIKENCNQQLKNQRINLKRELSIGSPHIGERWNIN